MPIWSIDKLLTDLWIVNGHYLISKVISYTLGTVRYFITEYKGDSILSIPYGEFELALDAIRTSSIKWEKVPELNLTDTDMVREFKNGCIKCETNILDGGEDLINFSNYSKKSQPEYTMQISGNVQNFDGKLFKNGEVIATY